MAHPLSFAEWRETEAGIFADDGEEGAADRMANAYAAYLDDLEHEEG